MPDLNEHTFITELIRQVDEYDPLGDAPSPTGAAVAAAVGASEQDAAAMVRRLLSRRLIEQDGVPTRLGDGHADWGIRVTSAGYDAMAPKSPRR